MRKTGMLMAIVGMTALPGCQKRMDEKRVRRIVREELRHELDARERARRKAARDPEAERLLTPPMGRLTAPPRRPPDTPDRAAERLRRRIATLEKLLARFRKIPDVKRERILLMEKQLAKMRRRLAKLPPEQ